jgi:hypothetical protein
MPTFRDAIRGLIPFGEHWTVSEIVDAIGRIHDADLAALRVKGNALADMVDSVVGDADMASKSSFHARYLRTMFGEMAKCLRPKLAAWNAPAPECPTCPARAGGGKGRR